MRCYICGKAISIKRTIKTLFKLTPIFRCSSCQKKYKLYLFRQDVPKESGMFYLYSLFKEDNDLNWLAFNDEVSQWFMKTLNKVNKGDYVFWLDKIDIDTLKTLDNVGNDVYILTKAMFII